MLWKWVCDVEWLSTEKVRLQLGNTASQVSIRDKMNTRSIRCTDISVGSSDFIPDKKVVFPLRIFFVFSVLTRVELQPAAMKSKLLS